MVDAVHHQPAEDEVEAAARALCYKDDLDWWTLTSEVTKGKYRADARVALDAAAGARLERKRFAGAAAMATGAVIPDNRDRIIAAVLATHRANVVRVSCHGWTATCECQAGRNATQWYDKGDAREAHAHHVAGAVSRALEAVS